MDDKQKLSDFLLMKLQECKLKPHDGAIYGEAADYIAEQLVVEGYRKQSDVISEFCKKINLIECEMFHKAHDIKNYCENKPNKNNWQDEQVWGEKRECDGKMIALQNLMVKIKSIAAEYGAEVE